MIPSTPSNARKVTDWSQFEISDKRWLPLDLKLESVASVIKNLDLRHVNISGSNRLVESVNDEKVIGFVCCSSTPIEFPSKVEYPKQWSFMPVRTENSTPTIQILNLCALNGKFRGVTYGYLLEKYLRDSGLTNFVYAITPVAFAHNIAAKHFPSKNLQQSVYIFAKLASIIVLISDDGRLYTIEESGLTVKDFVKFARTRLKCEVYTIVEDPFKELCRQLDEKKSQLTDIIEVQSQNKSNCYLDESFSYDDLEELRVLNEQIEDAESFELIVNNVSVSAHDNQSEEHSETNLNTSSNDQLHEINSKESGQERQIRQLEHGIHDLVKKIEDLKKTFPHIYWPQISDSDLYGSKEYLRFYAHYKKVIHVTTPKLFKSYEFAPIRTPKSAQSAAKSRKRADSSASSIPTSSAVDSTPKRGRLSKAFKQQ